MAELMSTNFNNYEFETFNGEKFIFKNLENTFVPTATTNYLFKSILKYNLKKGNTLDLGSGIGILGLLLCKKNKIKGKLYSSDLSKNSILSLIENSKNMQCDVDARIGSLFEPWKNIKFDNIINDVSGISKKVADLSPWFKNVPCDTGNDGTKLINKVLEQAPNYLNDKGLLFFPIISLSNEEKILETARKNFTNIILIDKNEWPLPKEMNIYKDKLISMRNDKLIDFKDKFGMNIITTSVYVSYN